ncbi:MAG TPA: glycosyltransferase [Herpetosiphonaceae bacterium]|nr:glycosyltransferase [Herpetosiphonaceae bacterium]
MISYGSRGDVQPFLALAWALHLVGHQVRLVGPANFADLARDNGVPFAPVGVDIQAYLRERMAARSGSRNVVRLLRTLRQELNDLIDGIARETLAACQGSDLLIGTGPQSASLAERLGIAYVEAVLQPLTPTRAFPSPIAPAWLRFGAAANYASHAVFEQIFWQIFRPTVNRVRTAVLGLPPYGLLSPLGRIRDQVPLRLHAYSAHVMPRPGDWAAQHQVTGFWFLPPPRDWSPPDDLRDFLAAGPPPVYIGFGSMMGGDPGQLTALVSAALARSGLRGILSGGWGALAASVPSDNLFFVENVPHHWLFPQMAAIVHHGGAGTTGAALRSGRPSIVVPFAFDQAFWGRRVAGLGVGPAPIPRQRLTEERLAHALAQATTQPALGERAAQLGALIGQEHGTAQALDQIHRALRQ